MTDIFNIGLALLVLGLAAWTIVTRELFVAVAGFIAATGVAVLFLVVYGVRRGQLWAWVGAVTAPVLGLAVALPAHYVNGFDTIGHLGLIYLAVIIFVVGALVSLRGIVQARRN